jgi:antitoxin (DNA-binding transcriptional repressor) of toxin-antitoxin stability system
MENPRNLGPRRAAAAHRRGSGFHALVLTKRLTKPPKDDNLGLRECSLRARLISPKACIMTTIVKVGEAKAHLSDILARVEAGEEIIIARGDVPIAKLTRIEKANDLAAVLAEARAARARAKSVTREEILAWKREGPGGSDCRGRRLDRRRLAPPRGGQRRGRGGHYGVVGSSARPVTVLA